MHFECVDNVEWL